METPDLHAAMLALWERFRDTNLQRVGVLEEASAALHAGMLDPDLRQRAEREAHKLAGAVGTFGFTEGSRLARELEHLLAAQHPPDRAIFARHVEALRRDLERPPTPGAED